MLEVLPRHTALYRSNTRGGAEAVIANLERLLVVISPLPQPDLFVADRYLAAAQSARIEAMLVVNKADLDIDAGLAGELQGFETAGYRPITVSASSGRGLDALREACGTRFCALVGQSGVGKSSLVARLVPDAHVTIRTLARALEGRHTTTASRVYALAGGGQLADGPGVRDFAPAADRLDAQTLGFREVAHLGANCRFLDCKHLREPDCAVRAGVEHGVMHARRYESYRRLRRLHQALMRPRERKTRRS